MQTNTIPTEPETVQSLADSPTELGATPCSAWLVTFTQQMRNDGTYPRTKTLVMREHPAAFLLSCNPIMETVINFALPITTEQYQQMGGWYQLAEPNSDYVEGISS